jgi:hypothetical protein
MAGAGRLQLIYVAAKLGIADLLQGGPKRSEEVARAVGADPGALHRVMRGLVSIGILTEGDDGRFGLAPLGECLQTSLPHSLRNDAIWLGEVTYPVWGDLLRTVQTGQPGFDRRFGASFFTYLGQHPEAQEDFQRGRSVEPAKVAAAALGAYDFSSARTLVDVGGGHGSFIAAVLEACPHVSGILFDTPLAVEGARRQLAAAGLADRCAAVAGDFFKVLPAGRDAYLLKNILHDWDDERALHILRNCRQAMPVHGKLLVIELLMPERAEASPDAVWSDLIMLVHTGGRERTEAKYRALLASAGFHLSRIIPIQSSGGLNLIEGVPA